MERQPGRGIGIQGAALQEARADASMPGARRRQVLVRCVAVHDVREAEDTGDGPVPPGGDAVVTEELLALRDALVRRGFDSGPLYGFDLTPVTLDRLHGMLQRRGVDGVELRRADLLNLGALPDSWTNFDLIVSASMLEYVPRDRLAEALSGLRGRLANDGRLVLFMTRRKPIHARVCRALVAITSLSRGRAGRCLPRGGVLERRVSHLSALRPLHGPLGPRRGSATLSD